MRILFAVVASVLRLTSSADSPNVIIVGGSSGMGKAAALATIESGGKCLLVSRSQGKLDAARAFALRAADEFPLVERHSFAGDCDRAAPDRQVLASGVKGKGNLGTAVQPNRRTLT